MSLLKSLRIFDFNFYRAEAAKVKSNIATEWKSEWSKKEFRKYLLTAFAFLIPALSVLPKYLLWNETREGFAFDDPILKLFDPVDVTWLTFGLIYASILLAFISLAKSPNRLMVIFQSYGTLVFFRIISMYLLPLDPPEMLIPLDDPFVQLFGGGVILEKDLFFSGHTSTMFLLYLGADRKKMKYIFLAATIFVGLSVIIQHVHYSVDVFVAPFFAFAAFKSATFIYNKVYGVKR
ncbi:MAG: phosphatase PAP2 family protein [Melioribacteraceae bacterium]|nr:phosphatase PAP2 family protein [Melioribacteraceae bacterium]